MTFNSFPYSRPDLEALQTELASLRSSLETAPAYDAFLQTMHQYDDLKSHVLTMTELAAIRHTLNTEDAFYRQENAWFDETMPLLEETFQSITDTILKSPFAPQLKEQLPETWFLAAEMDRRSFSPAIIGHLQKEAALSTAYQNLIASAQIPFQDRVWTLAELEQPMNHQDPAVRKEAAPAYWGWFQENEPQLQDLLQQLVQVRTEMARALGFENYIDLGYLRMHRFDYDRQDVAVWRQQVLEEIVPLCQDLYEAQKNRLGVDTLPVWQEKAEFADGNPAPCGTTEQMTARAQEMYDALSEETGKFFREMCQRRLMDLDARKGKAAGGYCTWLPDFQAPFIFANSNGTQSDVETLTHEAGHAFQVWSSTPCFPASLAWPTNESAEIHSMSMEFFTWPWMELFFKDQADRYRFVHLSGAVKFLPYGVLVDHFQHEVYAHPDWDAKQRNACWRRLEKQYLPHKDYSGIDVLERGGWWLRQLHIFMDPFYYIDYTLAQVAALQFLARMLDGDESAFADYLRICRLGGSLCYRQLLKEAGLQVPFDDGCLQETAATLRQWFETHMPEAASR